MIDDPWLSTTDQLRSTAEREGERAFLTVSGTTFSFGDAWDCVESVARGLRCLGLQQGDRVALLSENRSEAVWSWLGTLAAGGVDVPLNVEARGGLLAYYMTDSRPRVIIGTRELLERLDADEIPPLTAAVLLEDTVSQPLGEGPRYLTFAELLRLGRESTDTELANPGLGDHASIVYTSGTTGPSKGVMWPQGFYPATALVYIQWGGLARDLSIYCVQPLYHLDSRAAVLTALYTGGRVTLGLRFSARGFWDEIEQAEANAFVFIGTMLHLLDKQPDTERPPGSRILTGMGSATPESIHESFEQRFAVRLLEGYAMTESPSITLQQGDRPTPGTVGTESPLVEAAILDEWDRPVPDGQAGIMCVRPRRAHSMMMGYWDKPEATVEAFANLWFHTGDVMRRRSDGEYEYIGRQKDSIRRRGENVSAWEVEETALRHPQVVEAAAIGVPSAVGDEDVALLVVGHPQGAPAAADLVAAMAEDLPRYALPRYVEFVESLPKTPSERIAKGEVRARGLTAAAVDLQPDQPRWKP